MKTFATVLLLTASVGAQASDVYMGLAALQIFANAVSAANGEETYALPPPPPPPSTYQRDPFARYPALRDTTVICTTTGPDYHRTTTCH